MRYFNNLSIGKVLRKVYSEISPVLRYNFAMARKVFFLMLLTAVCPYLVFGELSFYDFGLPVPVKSEYYSVESMKEGPDPGFLTFKVRSAHAVYETEDVLSLIKLLHEIEVIEKIRRNENTSGFFDGAASSVEATADGLVKLVTSPIQSGKSIGRAAGKVGRSIGGLFRSKEEGEKSSFGESVLGSAERELAKQFGVDVYTRNPYLKALLRKMARARVGGKSFVFLATFLIPVGAISVAVTAGGINGGADQLVNDNDRMELYRLNKNALVQMLVPAADAEKFLNSPYFTPREATYIRTYMEQLHKTLGFRQILKAAAAAKSESEAHKILYSARLAAEQAKNNPESFQHIEIWGDGLKAVSTTEVIYILPYDYLQKNPQGKDLLNKAADEFSGSGKMHAEIWNGGLVDSAFKREAEARGVRIRSELLWKDLKNHEQV